MIASIQGRVQRAADDHLVVEVGGLGLRIAITQAVLDSQPEVGKSIFLHTYLVVREDALSLYGFMSNEERDLFETLLGVSGIGPKLAIAILSHLSPEVLRSSVVNNQPGVLAKVPGLGKKTAEKVVFSLKDKFEAPLSPAFTPSETDGEVLGVLTTLGYSMVEAQAAIQSLPGDAPDDVEERVRLALQYFAKP
jgi:Holliday junction DNA helicase RuvA